MNKFILKKNNLFQFTPTGPPSRIVFPGIYNFAVEIDGSHTQKKKYLVSIVNNFQHNYQTYSIIKPNKGRTQGGKLTW